MSLWQWFDDKSWVDFDKKQSKKLEEAFELLQNHRIKTDGLSTMYPMEKLNEAISDTLSNKIMKAYITL